MRVLLLAAFAASFAFAADAPAFDVASVRPFHDDGISPRNVRTWAPDSVNFGGCSLAFIIAEAYSAPPGSVIGPSSLTKETLWPELSKGYNVIGKAGHAVTKDALRLMLQSLLAERFHLVVHQESKTRPAYLLTVAKGGAKLEESQDPNGAFSVNRTVGGVVFRNAEMMRLAGYLSSRGDREVVDQTGLKGLFDFTLKLSEDAAEDDLTSKSAAGTTDAPAASRFASGLKQLGLQIGPGQAEIEYLVVDRVERPAAN